MICGVWGSDKTCKTTLGLTFPKPLVDMEFDIGGFDRAKYRFKKEVDTGLIKYEAYPLPVTIGKLDLNSTTIHTTKTVTGMKELFYKWLAKYMEHLKDPNIATIMIDTETLRHKTVNADCYLQELQETQVELNKTLPQDRRREVRTQLTQIEYREPNNRTRGVLYSAKAAGKNLVLIHHSQPEYKNITKMVRGEMVTESVDTGKDERSGFATLGDSADVIVHTTWDSTKKKPFCNVELCEVKFVEGMNLEEPSYQKLVDAIMMGRGI